jgi:hypothetical protein
MAVKRILLRLVKVGNTGLIATIWRGLEPRTKQTFLHYVVIRLFPYFGKKEVGFKSTLVWYLTPYSPLKVNRRFGATYRLHVPSEPSVYVQRTGRCYIPERMVMLFITTAMKTSNPTKEAYAIAVMSAYPLLSIFEWLNLYLWTLVCISWHLSQSQWCIS